MLQSSGTASALVGSLASFFAVFVAWWLTTNSNDRRDADAVRRASDLAVVKSLTQCERTCVRLREELALYRAVLIHNDIPLPVLSETSYE